MFQGGITSSDLATKALEAKRAKIVGQALAGVPLWQLGPESRHPGVPYIVFPGKLDCYFLYFRRIESWISDFAFSGNVGDSKALADVVKSWALPSRLSSTKELLLVSTAQIIFFNSSSFQILTSSFWIKNAEKGGYAVGAFNVYNIEGAEAVVAAAEQENSPAILQVRMRVQK